MMSDEEEKLKIAEVLILAKLKGRKDESDRTGIGEDSVSFEDLRKYTELPRAELELLLDKLVEKGSIEGTSMPLWYRISKGNSKLKETSGVRKTTELMAAQMPELVYWLFPTIPKNSLILYGGRPGAAKSLFILYQSLYMASGKNPFGSDKFEVKDIPKILYYDLDNSERINYWRISYISKAVTGISYENIDFCYKFEKTDFQAEFERAKAYDIVILDPYRRFLEGDENDSSITDELFSGFLKPLREQGKTVIIVHHFRKGRVEEISDEDIQDMFRGSSDVASQVDAIYGIFKTPDVSEGNKICFDVSVIKGKNRLGMPIKDFTFSVEKDDQNQKTEFTFKKFGWSDPNQPITDYIFSLLADTDQKRLDLLNSITARFRVSTPTIDRLLKVMIDNGAIHKTKRGSYGIGSAPKTQNIVKDNGTREDS